MYSHGQHHFRQFDKYLCWPRSKTMVHKTTKKMMICIYIKGFKWLIKQEISIIFPPKPFGSPTDILFTMNVFIQIFNDSL